MTKREATIDFLVRLHKTLSSYGAAIVCDRSSNFDRPEIVFEGLSDHIEEIHFRCEHISAVDVEDKIKELTDE